VKKVEAVQRSYLIRNLLLNAAIAVISISVSSLVFESEADIRLQVLGVGLSIAVGSIAGWLFIIRPLGKILRSHVEERERNFNERFKEIIDSMQECVIVYDRKGVVHWNNSAIETMGVSEADIRGSGGQVVHPSLKILNEAGYELLQEDRPTDRCFRLGVPVDGLVGLQKANGRTRWLRVHASPIFAKQTNRDRKNNVAPEVESVIANFRDITSEREALQRFELATKAVKIGVWDLDVVTGDLVWDDAMYRLYEADPLKVKPDFKFFESMVVDEDRDRVLANFQRALRDRTDVSDEFRINLPSGGIRTLRVETKGFYARDGRPLRHVGVNWDVTAEREQELRVLQASKMSSLGEMSAGIAHEINNPLAIILGKTEAMRTVLAAPVINRELMNRHIDTMDRTANRIARIVKGLRTFSRDGDQDPFAVTNVSEIIGDAVSLCSSRFLNNGIELHVTSAPTDLMIDVRAVQISQVLLNLLNNAFDAVSVLEEKWVRLEVHVNDREVEFSVTDSGSGIPEAIRAKLTQPFFTTKDVGIGTGLGLSIASGIVAAHGGTLEVDSGSPNTRFVIRIPRSQAGSMVSAA
jgi:PAS domain S-box-containing protein